MKRCFLSVGFPIILAGLLMLAGCTDSVFSGFDEEPVKDGRGQTIAPPAPREDAPYHPNFKKLRHPQLLDAALSTTAAGKTSSAGQVHLFLAYNEFEADGVTPRLLDQQRITRRILNDYGITRRVLDSYGITRRVLEDYGITARVLESYGITRRILDDYGITAQILMQYDEEVTEELLAAFGLTFVMLEEQGITRRVLDDYRITRRVLEDYDLSVAAFDAARETFQSVIDLRLRISKSRPGLSLKIDGAYFDVIMEELWYDSDIELIEPDPSLNGPPLHVREASAGNNEMIPWSLQRIGGLFTRFDDAPVHVYMLDSGVYNRDLNLVERKDFTMLFQNRDQEYMDEEEIIHLDVFDPGVEGEPVDESGHGTHVAGIIGAKKNSEGIRGVARGVKMHSLKVLTRDGRTDITTVMAAVDYVTDQKQRNPLMPMVMNLSLGMDLGSGAYNALDEAIQRAVKYGVVVVVSAGNDGRDATSYSPAHVREAITVAAYDINDRFASFSNYGPAVDILAPGDLIPSLTHLPEEASAGENIVMSGTSHAAPQVAGAAALYLALHPGATPAEVKQGLINHALPEIRNVPAGTTNRTVYVGLFADDGQTQPLSFVKADWSGSRQELVLEGRGPRLGEVELISGATDERLGTFTVDEQGTWRGTLTLTEGVPCAVKASAPYTDPAATDVREAPTNCLKPFAIEKAAWKASKQGLRVKGTGPQGVDVALLDAHTLAPIATMAMDTDGTFDFDIEPSSIAPCVVRVELTTEGTARELVVDGAEEGCDTGFPVSVKKAQWDPIGRDLKVSGTAAAHGTLDLLSAASGVYLTSAKVDYKGDFDVKLDTPPFVPCTVRIVPQSGGDAVDAPVANAPDDCEGAFRIGRARWDDATSSLEVQVMGPAFADLALGNARTGRSFHNNTLDARGRYTRTFRNMAVIPCAVSATADGTTVQAEVENKPFNCDVATVVNTLQWIDAQYILSVGGTATPASKIELSNADNGSLIEAVQVDDQGNWRIDADLSVVPVPPCNIAVRSPNGDVEERAVGAAMCNPDFVYRSPDDPWEQNPHSFIAISRAEWRASEGVLRLEGSGYVFMRVTFTSTNTGEVLGTTVVDQNENWNLDLAHLAVIPCSVTAELDGRTVTRTVNNAPRNCDGLPYLRLTRAEWKSPKLKVEGETDPNATVTLTSAATGAFVASVVASSSGQFRFESTIPGPVPCVVQAEMNGRIEELTVNKAPGSCQ